MDTIIQDIRTILQERGDPELAESGKRFFKEEVTSYGFRTAEVTRIAKEFWKKIAEREKEEIFHLSEELFRSGYLEEAFIVCTWLPMLKDRFEPADMKIFEAWIGRYITNWATCDTFCNHTVGDLLMQYSDCTEYLIRWTGSENRWFRRAAAVSLIVPAKKGDFLPEVFAIADRLLIDEDDLVRKGYGWLLKEASRMHRDEVFAYVQEKKPVMPKTALRYAIELMPADMRAEAMKKDWT